ncbi:MAG: hypothetical protein WAW79_03945 [Steroidobacteraceae bacterium]
MIDLARQWPESGLVRIDLAGQRKRHHRAAVKTAGERDDAGSPGMDTGDLDRILDGLGTGRHQQRLVCARTRSKLVEPFAQGDIGFVSGYLEAGVRDLVDLFAHRFEYARMTMAGVQYGDAAGEVDVTLPVGIPQHGIFGAFDIDWLRHRDAARHGRIASRGQGFVVFHCDLRAVTHFIVTSAAAAADLAASWRGP